MKILVKKAFMLRHGGKTRHFPIGLHTVTADIGGHWFVKANSETVAEPEKAEPEKAKPAPKKRTRKNVGDSKPVPDGAS